jgi:hypothetical protein
MVTGGCLPVGITRSNREADDPPHSDLRLKMRRDLRHLPLYAFVACCLGTGTVSC